MIGSSEKYINNYSIKILIINLIKSHLFKDIIDMYTIHTLFIESKNIKLSKNDDKN